MKSTYEDYDAVLAHINTYLDKREREAPARNPGRPWTPAMVSKAQGVKHFAANYIAYNGLAEIESDGAVSMGETTIYEIFVNEPWKQ